ncbi:5-formyltetrahydrofolate cyclo-ligase [Leekyejoonella antrihumi]|uniref:5-formyltetrahydrofolate cyclo-ligase n=1 Tax=Leekyejoonella antrihumi TaxID=1660198 RepID=A0A563E8Q7_9MICO|nr:5-formyltetrahydrofolate cyclo-ligase [Leekyejoonella antrihumi]TWP38633.1 5-formyltetrahydrofolate cyclo-ligase [Leekyejoonella antrihumi]
MWRDLPQHKRAARSVIRAARRARAERHDADRRKSESDRLAGALADRLARRGGAPGVLAAYRSLPTEPPSDGIIETANRLGWLVILPELLADKDLTWTPHDDPGRDLGTGAIRDASVVVVPALAVDRHGMRLGQGGGSYDRALARRSPGSWIVAVVHDDELTQEVPCESHDLPVDAVLTPQHGVIDLPIRRKVQHEGGLT